MDTAKDYLELMEYCITEQGDELNELIRLQDSYDNKIDVLTWPTNSQVPTAQQFTRVEEQLGPAMFGLFPETNGLQLIPAEDGITPDQWQRAEWALWTQLTNVMKLKQEALVSLKDCFKIGVGFGIVEPYTITPEISVTISEGVKRTRIMSQGEPGVGIRYRYLTPGQIIPYPDGSDFSGPHAMPLFFFYDPYPLYDVEAMYDGELPYGINTEWLRSDIETIKEAAVKFRRGRPQFEQFYRRMAGRGSALSVETRVSVPLEIPIIKVFEQPGTWTWIVPGGDKEGEIILKTESEVQQINSGLVKWSAWPDANRFYPMCTAEADRMRCYANDLWFNFVIDMMDEAKRSTRVINKSALGPSQKHVPDNEDIYISGSVRDAVTYLPTPRIDPAFMALGETIQDMGERIRGKTDFAKSNFTRGGTHAFQSLLTTMQARERLEVCILETGALTKIYETVLSYMRILIPEEGWDMRRVRFDAANDERIIEAQTIMPDDIRHAFAVDLDLSTRRMLGGMSFDERIRLYELMRGNSGFHPSEVARLLPIPEALLQRASRSREELEAIQAEDREMQLIQSLRGSPQSEQAAEQPITQSTEQAAV